jgi:hypothetical protein
MWKIPKPNHVNYTARRDNLVGFKVDKLPTLMGGEHTKQARELMKRALFKQWLLDHP